MFTGIAIVCIAYTVIDLAVCGVVIYKHGFRNTVRQIRTNLRELRA